MRASTGDKSCWIATDGAIGNEKQCQALAHYLGLEAEVFRISLRQPWQVLAPYLRLGGRHALPVSIRGRLSGPLPEVLITAGRRSALAAVTIKRLSQNRTFSIQLLGRIEDGPYRYCLDDLEYLLDLGCRIEDDKITTGRFGPFLDLEHAA